MTDRRALLWLLVLFDCVVLLVLAATAASYAQGEPLDLPVLPPGDPRRVERIEREPAEVPSPPAVHVDPEPEPPVFFGESIPLERDSIVYVLDFSGSMGVPHERVDYRTTLNRWDVAKREASRSIAGLSPSLRFGLVVFGTGGGCGVRAWRGELVRAGDAAKSSALAWLARFDDVRLNGGATPAGPGVVVGLELGAGAVVLLTDGSPSACGLVGYPFRTHRRLIAARNTLGARIDVFGIGLPDEYAQRFARGVAADSGGAFVEVR